MRLRSPAAVKVGLVKGSDGTPTSRRGESNKFSAENYVHPVLDWPRDC